MITWIISSTALLVTVLLVRFLFRKKISRTLQYVLWLPVALRLLIPLTPIESGISIMNILPGQPPNIAGFFLDNSAMPQYLPDSYDLQEENLEGANIGNKTEPDGWNAGINRPLQLTDITERQKNTEQSITGWTALSLLWLIGSVTAGSLFLGCNLVFYVRLKKSRRPYGQGENTKSFCTRPVYMTEKLLSPCLFGIFPAAIYVTPRIEEPGIRIEHVICHELCHYRHGDHIWSLLRGVCLSIWWWHPLVWIAAVLSKRDAELACDEAVIARIGEDMRIAYGHTLVDMVAVKRSPENILCAATTMTSSKKNIKERLEFIIQNPKRTLWAAVVVLSVIALCLAATLTGAEKTTEGPVENTPVRDTPDAGDDTSVRQNAHAVTDEDMLAATEAVRQWYEEEIPFQMGTQIYDIYSVEEVTPIRPQDWAMEFSPEDYPLDVFAGENAEENNWLAYLEENYAVLVKATLTVWYSNEHMSLGPQYGNGERIYYHLVDLGKGGNGIYPWETAYPPEITDIEYPPERDFDKAALMERLDMTQSQYRDYEHQLEALVYAKIDHTFASYMDFTREEFDRYMECRDGYFFGAMFEPSADTINHMIQYDFTDNEVWGGRLRLPEFVDDAYAYLSGAESVKANTRIIPQGEPYLIEEGLIGHKAVIQSGDTIIGVIEYRFAFQDGKRVLVAGGYPL